MFKPIFVIFRPFSFDRAFTFTILTHPSSLASAECTPSALSQRFPIFTTVPLKSFKTKMALTCSVQPWVKGEQGQQSLRFSCQEVQNEST